MPVAHDCQRGPTQCCNVTDLLALWADSGLESGAGASQQSVGLIVGGIFFIACVTETHVMWKKHIYRRLLVHYVIYGTFTSVLRRSATG